MTDTDYDDTPHSIASEGGAVIRGDVQLDRGSTFVGRDQIINNIQQIQTRAHSVAEEAKQARSIELEYLARGVSTFMQRLHDRAAETEDSRHPYKGLLEYRLSDAEIFFGRERDIQELLPRLLNASLTVLHSESGAGKTSLLQAGLSPQLIAAGHLPIYCRPYAAPPTLKIKQTLLPDLAQMPQLAAASLREFLGQVSDVVGTRTMLVVLLDQFEEFFIRADEKARAAFVTEFADCLEDDTLNVRWGLALRSEFFSNLATFRPRIRNPFENDYRLSRLSRAEAETVVARPADRFGVTFEAGLIDRLLDDLGKDEIAPPQIQLVCSALYSERGDARIITCEMYEREGGAAGILRGHLERVLSRDVPTDQRRAARQVLEALISSEPRRILRARAELIAELQTRGVSAETTNGVVAQLIDSRLVRPVGEGEISYELVHDYLLDEIKLDPAVQARKAAQELLDREVQSYQRYGTLLSDDKLAIVQPRRTELVLTSEAQVLLAKSERAFKRRRGILVGGVGLVAALVLIGVLASIAAIGATGAAQQADVARQQSVAQATAAAQERDQAQQESLIAQQNVSTAIAREGQAKSGEATAVAREAAVNEAMRLSYQRTGVIPVGKQPSAVTYDGQRLWVANAQDNTVQTIDPQSGAILQTVPVGRQPADVLFDGQRIWVANQSDDTLMAIDPGTGQILGTYRVITQPTRLAFDGRRVWATGGLSETVTVRSVDATTGELGPSIPITNGVPTVLAFAGQAIWVGGDELIAIEPETNRMVGTVEVNEAAQPIFITFADQRLWVVTLDLHGTYNILLVDPQQFIAGDPIFSGSIKDLSSLFTGQAAVSLAFDGIRIWIIDRGGDTARAYDPYTGFASLLVPVGHNPAAVKYAGERIWIVHQGDNTLQALDPMQVPSQPMNMEQAPHALLVVDDRLWVAGATRIQALGLTPQNRLWSLRADISGDALAYDGRLIWVGLTGRAEIVGLNPVDASIVVTIPVSGSASPLAFDGQHLWVAVYSSTTGSVLEVIDPITYSHIKTVHLDEGIVGYPITAMLVDGEKLWVAYELTVQAVDIQTLQPAAKQNFGVNNTALVAADQHLWLATTLGTSSAGFVLKLMTGGQENYLPAGALGNVPSALATDGQRVWVAYRHDGEVQAIDPVSGQHLLTMQVGTGPTALAFDGLRIWVANEGEDTIRAIYPNLP